MTFKTTAILFTALILFNFLVIIPKSADTFANPDCPASYDFNGDGKVDLQDEQIVAHEAGKKIGDPGFDPKYDLNHDGKIDEADWQIIEKCIPLPTVSIGAAQLPQSDVEKAGKFSAQGLPGQIVSAVLKVILPIAGFVTVIIIVISGIQFVTSGGNPEAAAAARGRLTFAIIGFVIIVLAFAILQIIDKLFLGNSGVV